MNKKSLVIQSNRLIEARYRLSIEEQKIVKILISQIKKDDEDFKGYEFRIKELAELLGMEHTNTYGVLRNITRRLMTRVLEFYNPETRSLLQASWLSSAEYQEGQGTVSLCFDPKLKPLLLQLKSYFTRYELEQIMQFRGQYTIRFFEFRKSFLGRKKSEVNFTLKELRQVLSLKKDEYDQFFDFKRRVLEPARLELLEKTGKSFTWEPVKQGRGGKIVGVRLVFDSDDDAVTAGAAAPDSAPGEAVVEQPAEETMVDKGTDEKQAVFAELSRLGLAEKAALDVIETYSVDRIREKLALIEQRNDINNQAGFFIEAIQGDWLDPTIEQTKRQTEKRRRREGVEGRKRELRRLKERFMAYKLEAAREHYQEAPETAIQQWRNEFTQAQPIWKSLLRGKKLDFEHTAFRAFVMERLSLPTLEQFLARENLQLSDDDRTLWDAV